MRWSRARRPSRRSPPEIEERIADCVFVAHNARFDHGFLKHAFARTGRPFSARPLCTVRLSRRLYPDADGHGLDALVARHGIAVTDRHRALGDARALWSFVEILYRTLPDDVIEAAVKRTAQDPELSAAAAARHARARARASRRVPVLRRSIRCPSMSARASTCAIASPRISRATGRPRPTCGSRRRSGASRSRRPPASWARCCAKPRS